MAVTRHRSWRSIVGISMIGAVLLVLAPVASASSHAKPAAQRTAGAHFLKVRSKSTAAPTANLTYHNGRVMATKETSYAIFWEPPTLQNGQAAFVSPTYNSLISQYFGDVGGNSLYKNNTQYFEKKGTTQRNISNVSSLGGSWVDTSAYPASDCSDPSTPGNCILDKDIQAEVTKAINTNHWATGWNSMFFVFTAKGEGSCTQGVCSFSFFCAYHGNYKLAGKQVIYANMPYTGTSLSGCGTPESPNGDFDADSTINVTSHEQMEAVTDPQVSPTQTGWWEPIGGEIGDKCAWNFGTLDANGGTANQAWNGHFYILQTEWSNAGSHCVQDG